MNRKILLTVFWILSSIITVVGQDVIVLTDSLATPEVELSEVVVGASKDNVKLKEMPASVSLLTNYRLEANQITELPSASAVIPNFYMSEYGTKLTSPVYIRGVGSRINAPAVGLYVDGVPYFDKASFNFDFFDVERLEVLRGPQGTLYGRNTMGGLINIETLSPFSYQGTNLKVSAGTYDAYKVTGNHYNVINDKVGYSLSVNYVNNGGYYHNDFLNSSPDDLTSLGFRNKLIAKLSSKLTIKNIASFEKSNEGGYPYSPYDSTLNRDLPISYNQQSNYQRDMFSDAFLVEYTGDNVNIKSTTSYQLLDDIQEIDQDFTSDSTLFANQDQIQNMFSQELIVRSNTNSKYKWLFGGFGFLQTFDKKVDVDIYNYSMNVIKTYDHTIYGGALFHQSTLNDLLAPGLSFTAGVRVDYEKDSEDYFYERGIAGNYSTVDDTTGTLEAVEVLPKFALKYSFGSSTIYTTVAKGYKTGGFNSTFDEDRPQDRIYDSERSWNYELGVKTALFNKMIYANAAVFYIDWDNQQIYQTNPSGYGSRITNAGQSVSKGAELSLQAEPFCGYNISVNYGYTHATFSSYVVDNTESYTGNFLPFVPRNTLAAQLNKTFHLNESRLLDNIKVNLLYRGLGQLYFNEENSAKQNFYGILSAKLSFVKNNLQLDIWGKNLTSENYYTHFFSVYDNYFVQTGRPVNFGLDLKIKF